SESPASTSPASASPASAAPPSDGVPASGTGTTQGNPGAQWCVGSHNSPARPRWHTLPPSRPATQSYWLPSAADPQQSFVVVQGAPSLPQAVRVRGSAHAPPEHFPEEQQSESAEQVPPSGWHAPTGMVHGGLQKPEGSHSSEPQQIRPPSLLQLSC